MPGSPGEPECSVRIADWDSGGRPGAPSGGTVLSVMEEGSPRACAQIAEFALDERVRSVQGYGERAIEFVTDRYPAARFDRFGSIPTLGQANHLLAFCRGPFLVLGITEGLPHDRDHLNRLVSILRGRAQQLDGALVAMTTPSSDPRINPENSPESIVLRALGGATANDLQRELHRLAGLPGRRPSILADGRRLLEARAGRYVGAYYDIFARARGRDPETPAEHEAIGRLAALTALAFIEEGGDGPGLPTLRRALPVLVNLTIRGINDPAAKVAADRFVSIVVGNDLRAAQRSPR